MPDSNFHIRKRKKFRDSGDYLRLAGPKNSTDAAVQDYFYSALHEIERFLSQFGVDSYNHRNRNNILVNQRIIQVRNRTVIGHPDHQRRNLQMTRTVENMTEFCYLSLYAMRQLKSYGSFPRNVQIPGQLGRNLFANIGDVNAAYTLLIRLLGSIARYEHVLRRRGFL